MSFWTKVKTFIAPYTEPANFDELSREQTKKAGDSIANALGMKFAYVPPGKSWLGGGGGKPGTTPFTLQNMLWCGSYPVTQAEWEKVMGDTPSHFKANPRYPVETVSWDGVQGFLTKLNKDQAIDGLTYRLPTCSRSPILTIDFDSPDTNSENQRWARATNLINAGSVRPPTLEFPSMTSFISTPLLRVCSGVSRERRKHLILLSAAPSEELNGSRIESRRRSSLSSARSTSDRSAVRTSVSL